jgi:RNA-binding protein Nova
MRSLGYSDSANTEVCAALGILAKYGILGVGVGGLSNGTHTQTTANPLSYLNVSALEQQPSQQTVGNLFGAIGGNLESFINSQQNQQQRTSIERFDASQYDPFRNAQATAPISLNNNFGLSAANATTAAQALGAAQSLGALSKSPTPGEIGSKDSKNVEIPEVIVGAILGEFSHFLK